MATVIVSFFLLAGNAMAQVRRSGREVQINTNWFGPQGHPDVAMGRQGRYVVIWDGVFEDPQVRFGSGVWAQQFRRGGRRRGSEFLVTDEEMTDIRGEDAPSVAYAGDGSLAVAWQADLQWNGDDNAISYKVLDSAGTQQIASQLVSDTNGAGNTHANVARTASGTTMVVWSDAGVVLEIPPFVAKARLYRPDGSPLSAPFPLAKPGGNTLEPRVVAVAGNQFIVVWWGGVPNSTAGADIFARRFDENGAALGEAFRLNQTTDRAQVRADVTAADDGGFLAVWESPEADGAAGIFARRFDANDLPVGEEHHVNTFTIDSQIVPAVENDGAGGFIVAWTSYAGLGEVGQDGSGPGVFGRRLHDDGSVDGLEFQINRFTKGAQGWVTWPIGLAARNGHIVAAWQSEQQDGFDQGIFAQRFLIEPGAGPLCGDANAQDLQLSILDAVQVLRAAVVLRPCLGCLCDTDGSGTIGASDATLVLKAVIGLPVSFQCPVCKEGEESPAGIYGFGYPQS